MKNHLHDQIHHTISTTSNYSSSQRKPQWSTSACHNDEILDIHKPPKTKKTKHGKIIVVAVVVLVLSYVITYKLQAMAIYFVYTDI